MIEVWKTDVIKCGGQCGDTEIFIGYANILIDMQSSTYLRETDIFLTRLKYFYPMFCNYIPWHLPKGVENLGPHRCLLKLCP